jgi:hypothetical protein
MSKLTFTGQPEYLILVPHPNSEQEFANRKKDLEIRGKTFNILLYILTHTFIIVIRLNRSRVFDLDFLKQYYKL